MSNIKIDVFKQSGKYYTTEYLDVGGIGETNLFTIRETIKNLIDEWHSENFKEMVLFISDSASEDEMSDCNLCNEKISYPMMIQPFAISK